MTPVPLKIQRKQSQRNRLQRRKLLQRNQKKKNQRYRSNLPLKYLILISSKIAYLYSFFTYIFRPKGTKFDEMPTEDLTENYPKDTEDSVYNIFNLNNNLDSKNWKHKAI